MILDSILHSNMKKNFDSLNQTFGLSDEISVEVSDISPVEISEDPNEKVEKIAKSVDSDHIKNSVRGFVSEMPADSPVPVGFRSMSFLLRNLFHSHSQSCC